MNDSFIISTDNRLLDINIIHEFLSKRSYWAKGRTLEVVQRSLDNSLCFGMYSQHKNLVGFGRVLTDYAVFACLMDVFIIEEYRGSGLGKKLVDYIMNFPALIKLKRWQLATADAHGLYEQYGFSALTTPEKHMEKVDMECC